ncbi:ATP-dependent zinc metalloprotease FtsH, partial [bacterium]|nr:ATP-dependent zinc metalloprotease FtsH [bacterium]
YFATYILPILLPFLLIGGLIFFMMRGAQGANSKAMMFGQSQAKQFNKEQSPKVTFSDVAGSKEAKKELSEVIEFLKFPKKFHQLGAKIPKGFLLLGGPGTGKTLMAKAVAGEADVPFFHISGSEFVEMFVGVGASRVRDLFKKARKSAPCIIFIDEIDAVARKRGAGLGGSHDEREQTLNQILVEMDGFDERTNVIVMAATNRPDVLDPALLRPGRFDRRIFVDNPDIREREGILKVHARKKPLAKDVSLKRIAERTPGFTGADLANLLNEAAISAARQDRKIIEMDNLFNSIEKVILGPERKSRVITEKEKKITAYHEAGHALVAHFLPNSDPVQKISIISRGQAGGYTLKVPIEDRRLHTKSEFIDELSVLLAGHITEKEIFKDVTTGASSDLKRATEIARKLVTVYGMSDELGLRTFGSDDNNVFLGQEIREKKDYSEKTSEKIDVAVSDLIKESTKKAGEIVKDQKKLLDKVAQALLEKETLEKEEFESIVGKKKGLEEEIGDDKEGFNEKEKEKGKETLKV